MDQVLDGLPFVKCILYDILVSGKNESEHLQNSEQVLARLQEFSLNFNTKRCAFFQEHVEFCGHKISKNGLHKNQDKIEAVLNAPRPTNVKELQSFIGLVTYYHKFLPNIASQLQPLYDLTKQDVKFEWGKKQQAAFERAKAEIASEQVLTHYDPAVPLVIQCDASVHARGAVLLHRSQTIPSGPLFSFLAACLQQRRNTAS